MFFLPMSLYSSDTFWFAFFKHFISQSLSICFLIFMQTKISKESLLFQIGTFTQLFNHTDLGISKVFYDTAFDLKLLNVV